jgi:GDP-4-dehydro-6-deoxy-D-mannose reductase
VAASLAVPTGSDVFNIGSCRQYSVIEVVQICERILGEPIKIVQDPARVRKVERQSLLAGIDKLTAATGWSPDIDLEQTLRELLAT